MQRANPEMLDLVCMNTFSLHEHTQRVEVLPVNKGELVDAIASAANLSKTDAENALNAFINTVQDPQSRAVTRSRCPASARSRRRCARRVPVWTRRRVSRSRSRSARAVKFTVGSEVQSPGAKLVTA